MPPGLMDEVLERIRETQVIMRTMSQAQAAQNNTPGGPGEENAPIDRAQQPPCPSPSEYVIPRRPEHDMEGPAPKRRRDSSHPPPAASPPAERGITAASPPMVFPPAPNPPAYRNPSENIPEYTQFNAAPQFGATTFQNEMDLTFSGLLPPSYNSPWSSSALRYTNMGQPPSGTFMSSNTSMQPFSGDPGTSTITLDNPFHTEAINQGWFDIGGPYNFGGEQSKPDDTPRTWKQG
jgi:hypothetical protein